MEEEGLREARMATQPSVVVTTTGSVTEEADAA
jgi:hypothetical protein